MPEEEEEKVEETRTTMTTTTGWGAGNGFDGYVRRDRSVKRWEDDYEEDGRYNVYGAPGFTSWT